VRSVCPTETTEFFELKFLRGSFFIFSGSVVSLLALGTSKRNDISHYSVPLST